MQSIKRAALGAAVLIGVFAFGTSAHAYLPTLSVNKCLSGQVKTEGKAAAAYTGCYSKNATKPDAGALAACNGKASTKLTSAFGKLESKPPCPTTGNGPQRDADTSAFASDTDLLVGSASSCDGAKLKLVGKYVAAVMGCYAKAAGKGGTVDNVAGGCTDKALVKFQNGINKAELKPPCSNSGGAALLALQSAANQYIDAQTCALDPGNPACPTCGNGQNDVGEACDATAPSAGWAQCGPDFTCVACNCACPTKVTFASNASDPATVLDTGWTGISHRAPAISNGEVSVALSCGPSSRPCGTCTISGPIANPQAGAGQIDNRRCTNDTSIKCANDTPCLGGGGTCQFFFGAPLPLAAGGVTTCVVNQFNGAVTGTANVESGEAANTALLTSRVYTGIAIDNPCPRCSDTGGINDGVNGGTCDAGPRAGQACDANGAVPGRPDFGRSSLDCPPNPVGIIATLPIDLSNATDPVTKTLTTGSPDCSGSVGNKCLCSTCNNAAATVCDDNADCVAVGATICGGRRCLSGPNAGVPCGVNSECPGGACSRPGEPTRPSSCLDDTSTANRVLECADGDSDGEGACSVGPLEQTCSLSSGHAQRACGTDGDCGGGVGSCAANLRKCFLTGGGTFQGAGTQDGTNTLIASGMEDPPMSDTSNPTLGAVFCVGPTNSASVNNVAGLPGPGRVTIKGTAVAHP